MSIYEELVKSFSLSKGENLYLSSELLKFALVFKRKGLQLDCDVLIEAFQDAIGVEGTLLIPNFSFEFNNNHYYDPRKTKGTSGTLGKYAMERKDFKRTKHPLHSFEVWGKDADLLTSTEYLNSLGNDSPFAYCLGHHVKQVILGTDYKHALTFVHYAEACCNVPYRFIKQFTGTYVTENGIEEQRTYNYFARKLEIEPQERFGRIGEILEERGTAQKIELFGIKSYKIDLATSFPIICEDIISNQCRNIYDFNIDRELIFK